MDLLDDDDEENEWKTMPPGEGYVIVSLEDEPRPPELIAGVTSPLDEITKLVVCIAGFGISMTVDMV